MNEPDCCEACGQEYNLRENNDPSRFCDPCAQSKLTEAFALLAEVLRRDREAITEMHASIPWFTPSPITIDLDNRIQKLIEVKEAKV